MNLLKMLATEEERYPKDGSFPVYIKSNLAKGLCAECDNKLCKYGFNVVRCEYHWLKHKYRDFSSKCRLANDKSIEPPKYPHLKKIKCKFDSTEFIKWCVKNNQYKKMKYPNLIRINKKGHYEFNNIKWVESKSNY